MTEYVDARVLDAVFSEAMDGVKRLIVASNALCVAVKNADRLMARGQFNDAHTTLRVGMEKYIEVKAELDSWSAKLGEQAEAMLKHKEEHTSATDRGDLT